MNIDQLLEQKPKLRYLRGISADTLRKRFGREKGTCTWCGDQLPPRRRRWCSQVCVDQFQLRCDPRVYSKKVQERDNGICQLCGLDVISSRASFELCWRQRCEETGINWFQSIGIRKLQERDEMKIQYGFGRGRWMEVDHIVPVSGGGGLCGMENLRLLCGKCHKGITRGPRRKR